MKKIFAIAMTVAMTLPVFAQRQTSTLKETMGKHFLVGTALNVNQVNGNDRKAIELTKEQFNSVVAENCMKPENIEPEEGKFTYDDADRFVKFGLDNNMKVIGHVLLWHSQTAPWMFKNKYGELPNREVMIKRLKDYITAVVGHFKGKILGWDVINEAILDDGSYRDSPWFRAIGPEYFELAFKYAHDADPDAELYYNDYSMSNPAKRATVCKLIRDLKAKGCRIDAVGMQSHNGYNYPDYAEYEKSIEAFAAEGVKVQLTELDVNMLPNPENFGGADISQNYELQKKYNPYPKKLDKNATELFNQRYLDLFKIVQRHENVIERVTFWGVEDGASWLNDWPIRGRTNYPLLFDRSYKAKPVLKEIIKMF